MGTNTEKAKDLVHKILAAVELRGTMTQTEHDGVLGLLQGDEGLRPDWDRYPIARELWLQW